jgi:hypothetical protein
MITSIALSCQPALALAMLSPRKVIEARRAIVDSHILVSRTGSNLR